MIPDVDFASSWPTDANGNSLGPITSLEGTSITAPQNGSGKYYWFADVQQYASGDNRYSDQWVPANIIDGASSGVKGSVPSSKADYVANSGTQSMGNSTADAFFHSTDAQQAWGSALDKLGSLVETSTLTALAPLAVSGKSLVDSIINCADQSVGTCAANVSVNAAFTLIGGFSTASQAKMFDVYSSVETAETSTVSNAAADGAAGTGVQNAVSSGTTASGIAQLEVQSAASVNEAMLAEGNQPAWLANTNVVKQVVPAGTQYQMVVSAEQADALNNGGSWFGAWATPDAVTSQAYARDNLSILPEFKSDVSFVVTVETTAPQTVNKGFAGPLDGTTGGGAQVEFVGTKNLKVVGQAQPLSKE